MHMLDLTIFSLAEVRSVTHLRPKIVVNCWQVLHSVCNPRGPNASEVTPLATTPLPWAYQSQASFQALHCCPAGPVPETPSDSYAQSVASLTPRAGPIPETPSDSYAQSVASLTPRGSPSKQDTFNAGPIAAELRAALLPRASIGRCA